MRGFVTPNRYIDIMSSLRVEMIGMPSSHKLLITLKIIPPKKYKAFLSEYETTTGLPTQLEIEIENIGKNRFPGAVFVEEQIVLETAIALRDVTTGGGVVPPKIRSLKPEEKVIIRCNWTARIPGPSRVAMYITAKGNGKINFYRTRTGQPREEWHSVFYVVDRHQLDLALLLQKSLMER